MITLANIGGVEVFQEEESSEGFPFGKVSFTAGFMVDADGANGQTCDKDKKSMFAYAPKDTGLDYLANAGYHGIAEPSAVYNDILICTKRGRPITFGGAFGGLGFYSRTTYFRQEPEIFLSDRWLDAANIPYMVVNPIVRKRAKGIVLGCKAKVTYMGLWINGVVGDVSGASTIGEGSIKLAELLGINPDPRHGGIEAHMVTYEFWPGVPANIDGEEFRLIGA